MPSPRSVAHLLAAFLLLAGCSPLGPSDARVRLRFTEREPLGRERLEAMLYDGRFEWQLLGSDLEPAGEAGVWQSREIRVGSNVPLYVLVAIRADDGTIATGLELSLDTTGERRWLLDVVPAASRAAVQCASCDAAAVPLRGELRTAGDSLVVMWRDAGSAGGGGG